ncbi:MAG: hypothetical protein R6U19_01400 [Bacteroidales bacterium]
MNDQPSYIELQKQGELQKRGQELWDRMESCDLCPRSCNSWRLDGQRGFCNASDNLEIASYGPHFGFLRPKAIQKSIAVLLLRNISKP